MTHPNAPAPQPPTDSQGTQGEIRISTVVGDRLCIRCAFNLVGQPVVREPVYRMLIVRCPECAEVASLQEYPLLGRWGARLAAAAAGMYLLILIAAVVGTVGLVGALCDSAAREASSKAATAIATAQHDWYKNLDDAAKSALSNNPFLANSSQVPAGPYTWIDLAWWGSQDSRAVAAKLGGWARATDWKAAATWPWIGLACIIAGAFWSVVVLAQPRWKLMLLATVPVLIAGGLEFLYGPGISMYGTGFILASDLGFRQVGWQFFTLTLALTPLGLWSGIWVGRPLVRGLARALLPPRMLGSLAFLWIADRKPPPRPRRLTPT